jgi:hypothetical protein
MKSFVKPLLISALLASSAMLVQAQMPMAGQGMMQAHAQGGHGRMDPAKMQERMAARQAELKASLGLSAAQEAAWADYVAAMQPPANHQRMNRDERQKMHQEMMSLATPQRLDRMAAVKAERDAQMHRREQATRNFYDALTPEQQKTFDANSMMGGSHGQGKAQHRHG